MSTKTTSTTVIPEPSAAEKELTEKNLELIEFELERLKAEGVAIEKFGEEIKPFLEAQSAEADRLAARARDVEPIEDEILDIRLEELRRGGAASPEQLKLIGEAGDAALEAGGVDIERFRTESLEALRSELAPALGLRPSDTPILDRGGKVAAEATRQGGQLASRIRESQASAKLNFPLAAGQLTNAIGFGLQQTTEATRQFQASLAQQAFVNRLNVTGLSSGIGLSLSGNPAGTIASGASPFLQSRLASGSTTSTTGGLGATISGISSLAGGAGGILRGFGAVKAAGT